MTDALKLETRCSLAIAARYLGTTRRDILNRVHSRELRAWDMRAEGAKRPHYVVCVSSIRELLEARELNRRPRGR